MMNRHYCGVFAAACVLLIMILYSSFPSELHNYFGIYHKQAMENHSALRTTRYMTINNAGRTGNLLTKDNNSALETTRYMTITDEGRTGNLLYKLFSLYAIAKDTGYTPLLPFSMTSKLGRLLNMSSPETVSSNHRRIQWKVFQENSSMKFDRRVLNLDQRFNWSLNGFFQSWKYFQKYDSYIREKFKFRKVLMDKAYDFLKENGLTSDSNNSLNVCIHVRRGDTLKSVFINYGYVDVPVSYFNTSIAYVRRKYAGKELKFIVASDDMEWCKGNIAGRNIYYSTMHSAEEDFVLMTICDHIILSVGSFGRMAGWFVSGDVIYFSDFPRPGSTFYNKTNLVDIYPEKWIGLK